MYKDPLESITATPQHPPQLLAEACSVDPLEVLLRGDSDGVQELPPLSDLVAGVIELCEGARDRVLLPLSGLPAEFALQRDGGDVLVDCYGTDSTPEVYLRHHRVSLSQLRRACVQAARAVALSRGHGALAQLAERAAAVQLAAVIPPPTVLCSGGLLELPERDVPLAFGFQLRLRPSRSFQPAGRDFADVHALLFDGELWAFSGQRRVALVRGPVLLATQRMAAAVRALLSGWQSGRDMHVRLCSGDFSIAVRLTRGLASLELCSDSGRRVFIHDLSVPQLAQPILRLCTDMLRKLVAVDRSQSRNLRVSGLRHELRWMRRLIRTRERRDGFVNPDPERLRMTSPTAEAPAFADPVTARPGRLRYNERWSVELEGLDAAGLYACDDRLLAVTPKLILAIDCRTGEGLWSLDNDRAQALLVGQVLLTLHGDGELRLTDTRLGQVYATTRLTTRLSGVPVALFGGGGELPPTALISDGHKSLWSVDLRTGELRFRYRSRGAAGIRMVRAGRVLLVTSGDGSVDALDIASGEVVWRHWADTRFCLPPVVIGQVVVAVAGEPNGGHGELHGIELFTGQSLWRTPLPKAPSAPPLTAGGLVVAPHGGGGGAGAQLLAVDPAQGHPRFSCADPGLAEGGRAVVYDDQLIVNTPAGYVQAIAMADGRACWRQLLSNPVTDDLPRSLRPVVRRGMLFVPAAQVHVLRPADGAVMTKFMGCDLVPDFVHVDDLGHLYVAEESGHLRAYGTGPNLSLVLSS